MQQSMTSPSPSMTSHQPQGSMTPQSRSMTPQQPVVMTHQQHPGSMTPQQQQVAMTPQTVVMTSGVMTPQQQGGITPSYQQHSTIIQQPHGVSMVSVCYLPSFFFSKKICGFLWRLTTLNMFKCFRCKVVLMYQKSRNNF